MATKTFDELKQLAIQIRDENTNKQNTANRVGAAMLEAVNKLEQDYYDKTNIDEQSKNTTQSITNLDTKIDKRTTEYNVSVNNPTSGTNGENKYDLASAIGQVPAELRTDGATVSFLNESGDTEKWEFGGGSWAVGSFSQVGAMKLTELDKKVGCIGTLNESQIEYNNGKIVLHKEQNYYIFLSNGIMIKYTPASEETYDIDNYGALVYDFEDNTIKALVYSKLRDNHIILLFRNANEPNNIVGGRWYNSYYSRLIRDELATIKEQLTRTIIFEKIPLDSAKAGRISSDDGSIQEGNESLYIEILLAENVKVIEFNASIYSGNFGYAFFSDETFIEGHRTDKTETLAAIKPIYANKMRISWNRTYVNEQEILLDTYFILPVGKLISRLENDVNSLKEEQSNIKNNFFVSTENLVVFKNLVNLSEIELGKYVRHDGTEGSAFNWYRTGYIEVEEGQIYTAFDYRTSHVALYNSDKVIQPDAEWQSGQPIPNGIKFIKLNQDINPPVDVTIDMVTIALVKGETNSNPGFIPCFNPEKIKMPSEYVKFCDLDDFNVQPFKDKGLFCAGDSQTMYGKYFTELLRVTGMKMVGNTGDLGNGGTSTQLLGFLKQMDSQGLIKWNDIDVFTVLIGGNDYGGNTEKGVFGDEPEDGTIYGGIKGVIDYVMSKKSTIIMAFFTRPERDNVENIHNENGYWFTTKKLKGISKVIYTGNVEPSDGCTDGGVAICGYDDEGYYLRNILEAKGSGYTRENITIPSDCKQIRICSKGSTAGEIFSFEITSDGTSIPTGTILTESNIDEYREKSSYVLPKGYIANNSYYNMYIWKNGYCDNRSYHYAPGPNLKGNTMYDIGETICDCAKRMGVPCLDIHNMCNVVHGYNLRDLMPDGTHFEKELADKIGRFMGNYINTLH